MELDTNSLVHTKWNCKYYIVFETKCRRQAIYGKIKADIGRCGIRPNFNSRVCRPVHGQAGKRRQIKSLFRECGESAAVGRLFDEPIGSAGGYDF